VEGAGDIPAREEVLLIPGLELVEVRREPGVIGSGADAYGDEDDSSWPKRQEVA
jgi:hypothetical protein